MRDLVFAAATDPSQQALPKVCAKLTRPLVLAQYMTHSHQNFWLERI